MKKKTIILSIVLLVIVGTIVFLITRKDNEEKTVTYKDVKVSTQNITNTLTSSGEVTSLLITKTLNTNRYFDKIYYSEGDYIKKGAKIIRYTNGTYYKAPYNLVLVSYNLPDEDERITSRNYLEVKGMNTLRMEMTIDESEILKVKEGQKVDITLSAIEGTTYEGEITQINQIGAYSSSGTKYTATVKFTNNGKVKLGMSGSVSIILESVKNAISVPIEAIQTNNNSKYVVVVNEDDTTSNITVETGISNAAYVEIKSGLTGDETIRMIETTTTTSTNRFMGGNGNRSNYGGMPRANGDFNPGQRN